MVDEDILRFVSEIFIGDKEKFYKYKTGPEIYKFFNKYFNYTDKYQWGGQNPSRWQIALNKLIDIYNSNRVNKFFSIILGISYLHLEYPDLTNDQLADKANEIMNFFNSRLRDNELTLLSTSGGFSLISINDDLEYIGDGGFATVYKIKSKNIVMKKLKEENYVDKGIVSRFKREYEMTKKLYSLPGVINVFDFNSSDLSYTMELAEMDLYKYITTNDIPNDKKMLIIYQVIDVMKKVHNLDIIHRDISPNNVLLFSGLFKMSDFGLGKDLSIFNSHQTNKTNSYGQFYYCDPKQFMKLKDGDKISDIYSIGKLINFIFTKDPNNSSHQLKGVSEKATAMSELARYKSVEEMEKAINSIMKILSSQNYKKEILDKISKKITDETVISYVNTLNSKDLFFHLQDCNFRYIFKVIIANYENSENLFTKLNMLYEEMKNKNFDDLDAIGEIALHILKEHFEFTIKEAAVDILNYIIDCNRWDIMKLTKQLINNGIDPLLEEKLKTEDLKDY